MATTLQIEFNCLCLFVRDPVSNVVHVLMPDTRNHNHGGHTHAQPDAAAVTGENQAGAPPTGDEAGEPSMAGHSSGEDPSEDAGLPQSIQRPPGASQGVERPTADSQAAEPSHTGHQTSPSDGENASGEGSHTGRPAPSSGGESASGEQPPGEHHPEDSDGEVEADGEEEVGRSHGGERHDAHDGLSEHVVRLLHPSFPEGNGGRPLEGWTLELGPQKGEASTDLTLLTTKAEIVDLDKLTEVTEAEGGRKVKPELITTPNSTIATRITLRTGKLISLESEAVWKLNGKEVHMAHRGVWEIDNAEDALEWKSVGGNGTPPPKSLTALGGEQDLGNGKKGYRLRVFHVTENSLPPNDFGTLKPKEVKEHFRVFYEVVEHSPAPHQLPEPGEGEGKTVNCGMAQAQLA